MRLICIVCTDNTGNVLLLVLTAKGKTDPLLSATEVSQLWP